MPKQGLRIVELCSGIGAQYRGLCNTGLFNVESVATSEIDKDAVLSYAAIHCGLTNEMIDSYDYPPLDAMRKDLTDLNLGYIPEKEKIYDWYKSGKKFERNIKKYWLACKLSKNLGDVSKIGQLPESDVWFCSFPCFVEGTLVLTESGYKPIEDIEIGEKVITHTNNYRVITNVMTNEADSLIKIRCMPSEDIHCTPNHPFYVRKRHNLQDHETGKRWREFDEPEWIPAKDLTTEYYVGTAINQKEEIPEWNGIVDKNGVHKNRLSDQMNMSEFWYVIGRFIGDGWIRTSGGIVICANDTQINELIVYLDILGWNYSIAKEKTVNKVHIAFKEISEYCKQFGRGAVNKHLTSDILNLPIDLLKSFIEGYVAADGYQDPKGMFKISSVSRQLMYEVSQCVAKAYHRPSSMYFTARPKTTVIEGRVVNQHDTYTVTWKMDANRQDQAFYEDGYVWCPIRDVIEEEYSGLVYNISVDEDESYMVQNVIVHNCQSISVAGKLRGMSPDSGTRSSLVWQTIRLLQEAKENGTLPQFLFLENVKNLVGKKFIRDFETFNDLVSEYGYNVYYNVINSCECGVPQNRERVFALYIRKDIDTGNLTWPIPFDSGIRLKDILDEKVDENYFINTQKAKDLIQKLFDDGIIGEKEQVTIDLALKNPKEIEIANCVSARTDRGISNRQAEGSGVAVC